MLKYKQISLEEREKIYGFLKSGISLTEIGKLLERNKSSISREISRNKSIKLGYLPDRANNLSKGRKNRNLSKIEKFPSLKKYIIDRLSLDKWSPEMIAGRMNLGFLSERAKEREKESKDKSNKAQIEYGEQIANKYHNSLIFCAFLMSTLNRNVGFSPI